MDVHFCDICNESVPQRDLDQGRAFLRKGRVVCAACDLSMGGGSPKRSAGAWAIPTHRRSFFARIRDMASQFPSAQWLNDLHDKLNTDRRYAALAKNWEGDISLVIQADDSFPHTVTCYLDLWHGQSRSVEYLVHPDEKSAAFTITAPFSDWLRILQGKLYPIHAMVTMRLKVRGNMSYIMRNVPTVLDFTRVARETPHVL
jgi:putative sterol carrier protein